MSETLGSCGTVPAGHPGLQSEGHGPRERLRNVATTSQDRGRIGQGQTSSLSSWTHPQCHHPGRGPGGCSGVARRAHAFCCRIGDCLEHGVGDIGQHLGPSRNRAAMD